MPETKLSQLYKETLENPNTLPETLKWLADYLDEKHKPVEKKPDDKKLPLEFYPDGEVVRYLSDGTRAPKRNEPVAVGNAVESFAEKYHLDKND